MALASLDDINVHLPGDKIEVPPALYDEEQLDAERIVRGYLSGYVDPAILAGWTSPDTTPDEIRAVVGRLVAAFHYRLRYSEDSLVDPEYALLKYNEAISLLTMVQQGTITLPGVPVIGGLDLEAADFWPNDSTTDGPFFTMGMKT
jgi:hypothetical protein